MGPNITALTLINPSTTNIQGTVDVTGLGEIAGQTISLIVNGQPIPIVFTHTTGYNDVINQINTAVGFTIASIAAVGAQNFVSLSGWSTINILGGSVLATLGLLVSGTTIISNTTANVDVVLAV